MGRLVAMFAIAGLGCGRVGFDARDSPSGMTDAPTADADLMTDPQSCGRVGHDCLAGTCSAGVCQPFSYATAETQPWGIAIDATTLYWTNNSVPGSVRSCPLAGCTAGQPTTIASLSTDATRVAIDTTRVYFSEFDAGDVIACPLAGCGATPTTLASGENAPMGVLVVGNTLYWGDSGGTTVRMIATDGSGTASTLAGSQGGPRTLVTDGTNIYWTNAGGEVTECPLGSCADPTTLAINQGSPYFLEVYAGDVYWSNNVDAGAIMVCPSSGCGGNPTVFTTSTLPNGLAVDATGVYWLAGDADGSLLHCPLTGCGTEPDVLATNLGSPFALVTDSSALYWTDSTDGTVRAVARP